MPRLAIDFSKNVIYKLVCKDVNIKECYVGHTTDFTNRKYGHKSNCINPNSRDYNYYVYQFINKTGGWNNWSMIMIEEFPCKNVNEAAKFRPTIHCHSPSPLILLLPSFNYTNIFVICKILKICNII